MQTESGAFSQRDGGAQPHVLKFEHFENHHIRFCTGRQAVNAYVEPLVSLDFDLAVVVDQIDELRKLVHDNFASQEFANSLIVSSAGSNLRIQIHTDPRYGDFVSRSSAREVLRLPLPVATIEGVLQGKV